MIEARRFFPLLAAAGALVLVHRLFDLGSGAVGVDLATPSGRVRFLALAWSMSPGLVVADVCLIAAALGLGSGRALRGLAVAQFATGLVLLAGIPLLLASAAGVSHTVGGSGVAAFQLQIGRMLLGLTVLGGASLLAGRALSDPRIRARS